jgi:NAD(P)-dependent dehydrogenase (short-subunit alcohol dehydrogenase family)
MAFQLTPLFDLTGRTALITGSNSGIGLAMARALGLAGAKVALVARRAGAQHSLSPMKAEGGAVMGAANRLNSKVATSHFQKGRPLSQSHARLVGLGGCAVLG